MTLDADQIKELVTLFGAVVAAIVALWNAFQGAKLNKKVDETQSDLKALRKRVGGA